MLAKGKLATAGLYFNNGISQEPGNWEKIHRYQQNIVKYCQQLIVNGEYEIVFNILSDMDTFMRSQALSISITNIDKLQLLLAEIAQLKQSVVEKINGSNKENATITAFVKQAEQFINKAKLEPIQSDFILYYLTSAESIISQLVLSAPEAKSQVVTLSKQLGQAKQEIADKQSKIVWNEIEKAYTELEINKVAKLKKEIERLTKSKYILFKKSKTLVSQNASVEKLHKVRADLKQVKAEIKQLNTKANKVIKAKNAIKQLTTFRQLLAGKMNRISSTVFLEKVQILAHEVNNAIIKWQKIQSRRYERWAINRITRFYDTYGSELGMNSDEDKMYRGIITLLGSIDTRYLSTPAQTAYNEVFQKFYAELRDNQKIPLSAEMTLKNKKLLTDF